MLLDLYYMLSQVSSAHEEVVKILSDKTFTSRKDSNQSNQLQSSTMGKCYKRETRTRSKVEEREVENIERFTRIWIDFKLRIQDTGIKIISTIKKWPYF